MKIMAAEDKGRVVITENILLVGIVIEHDNFRCVMHKKLDIKKAGNETEMATPICSMRGL